MKLKNTFSILFVIIFTTSCGNLKTIKTSQIHSMYFEYSPNQNINVGSTINGEVIIETYDGKLHSVEGRNRFSIISSDLKQVNNSNDFIITKRPQFFSDDLCKMTLYFSDKKDTYSSKDSIRLNYMGPLNVLLGGTNGGNGVDQKNRRTPLLFRDGKNGADGTHGINGESARDFTAHIWKDSALYYIRMTSKEEGLTYSYKMSEKNIIHFNLSGGNGGNGGDGGNGGNGKNGEIKNDKVKSPGNAGNGGNGGRLILYIHTNCTDIEHSITTNVKGGKYGSHGTAGKTGLEGTPLPGQQSGRKGYSGAGGAMGYKGIDGTVHRKIETFDFSIFK